MQVSTAFGDERSYGEVDPWRSLLRLDPPSGDQAAMRAFQTFRLPALLMAGYRQQFTPARTGRTLYRRATNALFEAAAGDTPVADAAGRIDEAVGAARTLHERWHPVATTVDRFFVWTMVEEDGYLDQMAAVFGAMHPDVDEATASDQLTELAGSVTLSVPRDDVLDRLTALRETYGRVPAEVVADVALDAPLPLSRTGRPWRRTTPRNGSTRRRTRCPGSTTFRDRRRENSPSDCGVISATPRRPSGRNRRC
ncbi:hypothetical protein SY89_03507 [Halolamina pelagica]|uniref:Uncharacterized protein n=1 Tax=Halolamina pelagica TaxID=699431 RepID=A0A0P7FRR4_9EURY|nr:hypothetical protein [Halolamina pelagica]KPN28891.1 hypothetical protein SY89_03125 [Halolamina pelagica]KPN29273.1 hypothetical protein SY89_03507 [Halolamina pelagica]